jgi:hypothetical protein
MGADNAWDPAPERIEILPDVFGMSRIFRTLARLHPPDSRIPRRYNPHRAKFPAQLFELWTY